eukprot:1598875-Prymnesium_polylepis.1
MLDLTPSLQYNVIAALSPLAVAGGALVARGEQAMMATEGVDGAWFQSPSAAGAAATRGDGCGQGQRRMAPNGGASNDATGGAAVALGGTACAEVCAVAGT